MDVFIIRPRKLTLVNWVSCRNPNGDAVRQQVTIFGIPDSNSLRVNIAIPRGKIHRDDIEAVKAFAMKQMDAYFNDIRTGKLKNQTAEQPKPH